MFKFLGSLIKAQDRVPDMWPDDSEWDALLREPYEERVASRSPQRVQLANLFQVVANEVGLTEILVRKLGFDMLVRVRSDHTISVATGLNEELITRVRHALYVRSAELQTTR